MIVARTSDILDGCTASAFARRAFGTKCRAADGVVPLDRASGERVLTNLLIRIAGCGLAAVTSIAGVGADAVAMPSPDHAITCEQTAMELSGYGQQMMPNIQAFAASRSQLHQQAMQKGKQRMVEEAMLLPLAEAGAIDPTGTAKRAFEAAVIAQHAKQRAENDTAQAPSRPMRAPQLRVSLHEVAAACF